MAKTFKAIVSEHNNGSKLLAGRTKLETQLLLDTPLVIEGFDILTNGDGEIYTAVTFKEYPEKFIFGGAVLNDLLLQYKNNFEGMDTEKVSNMLGAENVGIILTEKKSKKGRTYIDVTLID